MEKYGRAGLATDDNIIWRMRFACWIPKDIDTNLAYLKVIAFPQQKLLSERASNLLYNYVTSVVTLRKVATY